MSIVGASSLTLKRNAIRFNGGQVRRQNSKSVVGSGKTVSICCPKWLKKKKNNYVVFPLISGLREFWRRTFNRHSIEWNFVSESKRNHQLLLSNPEKSNYDHMLRSFHSPQIFALCGILLIFKAQIGKKIFTWPIFVPWRVFLGNLSAFARRSAIFNGRSRKFWDLFLEMLSYNLHYAASFCMHF